MDRHLLIKLETYEIAEDSHPSKDLYYSFNVDNYMYFTSMIDTEENMPLSLNDHIIIPLQNGNQGREGESRIFSLPDQLQLSRWERHMIMFSHHVDISDLKTRVSVRKRYETQQGEILSFMVSILNPGELQFGNKYIQSISQHYLTINNFQLQKSPKKKSTNPYELSYIYLKTSNSQFSIPIVDCKICIKLPETLQFMHIIDEKIASKSQVYTSEQLKGHQTAISLQSVSNTVGNEKIIVNCSWGINLQEQKPSNNLLLEAHQILLYDIELKIQNIQELTNCKLKVIYGNKAFQIYNFEGSVAKTMRIRKVVFFMIKSEDEEFHLVIEKKDKVLSAIKIYTQDISIFSVVNIRKKFNKGQGSLASVKFKCEKGKNLSVPNNNQYWKQCLTKKKKIPLSSYLLSFDQMSVKSQKQEPLDIIIKNQSQQILVQDIPNFNYFNPQLMVQSKPEAFLVREEQSIYVMLKPADHNSSSDNAQDFFGIALLNLNDLRLGINSVQIPFYLNHQETGIFCCLINKIAPYPFVKSSFQPELTEVSRISHKTISLAMQMGEVRLNEYFYTYQYDNKDQLYCIVEVNRIKKVLIMNNRVEKKSRNSDLLFSVAPTSDRLNFIIDETEHLKLKITFLVSDLGREQEIYGTVIHKIATREIYPELGNQIVKQKSAKKKQMKKYTMDHDGQLIFNEAVLTNSFGTLVGVLSFAVKKGTDVPASKLNSQRKPKQYISRTPKPEIQYKYNLQSHKQTEKPRTGPFNSQIRKIRNNIDIINKNMESIQKQQSPHASKQKSIEMNLEKQRRNKNRQAYLMNQITTHAKVKPKQSINPIRNSILNHSIDIKKDIRYDNSIDYGRNKNKRYSENRQSVKLPSLKQSQKKGSLQELFHLMQIRKKGRNGQYEQQQTLSQHPSKKGSLSSRRLSKKDTHNQSSEVKKIERQNPNIKRNMEILFPKNKKEKKQKIKKQMAEYEDKLKGLKSVLSEISQGIDEIEPEERQLDNHQENKSNYLQRQEPINLESPQFQDNEFALQMEVK